MHMFAKARRTQVAQATFRDLQTRSVDRPFLDNPFHGRNSVPEHPFPGCGLDVVFMDSPVATNGRTGLLVDVC